jgi:hypothetical protein
MQARCWDSLQTARAWCSLPFADACIRVHASVTTRWFCISPQRSPGDPRRSARSASPNQLKQAAERRRRRHPDVMSDPAAVDARMHAQRLKSIAPLEMTAARPILRERNKLPNSNSNRHGPDSTSLTPSRAGTSGHASCRLAHGNAGTDRDPPKTARRLGAIRARPRARR